MPFTGITATAARSRFCSAAELSGCLTSERKRGRRIITLPLQNPPMVLSGRKHSSTTHTIPAKEMLFELYFYPEKGVKIKENDLEII